MLNKPDTRAIRTRDGHARNRPEAYDDDAPPMKDVKLSRIDPDSGFMARDDKPAGFCC
jgi:hypothetical protein